MSFNCINILRILLNNDFLAIESNYVFTNDSKINKIPDKSFSNICYRFTSSVCNTMYVGFLKRAFHVRIMEHTGICFTTGQKLYSSPFSIIRDHARESNYQVSKHCN